MRTKPRLFAAGLILLVTLLTLASPALAKGPVDKITVTGPGLSGPIDIGAVSYDPWTRRFVDWARGLVAEPPPIEQSYTVSFYLKTSEGSDCVKRESELCLIYVLRYSPDPSRDGRGHLYFPAPGEPSYRVNIGTIISGDSDRWDPNGKWHYATAKWDAVMLRALTGPPDRIALTGPGLARPIEITDQATLAGFEPWAVGVIDRDKGVAFKLLTKVPRVEHTYEVAVHVGEGDGAVSRIYTFHYYPDPTEGKGYVYESTETYVTGGIWTGGVWRYATADWDSLVQRLLTEHEAITPGSASPLMGVAAEPVAPDGAVAQPRSASPATGHVTGGGEAAGGAVAKARPDSHVTGAIAESAVADGAQVVEASTAPGVPVGSGTRDPLATSTTSSVTHSSLALATMALLTGAIGLIWRHLRRQPA